MSTLRRILATERLLRIVAAVLLGVPVASAQQRINPATEASAELREASRLIPNLANGEQHFRSCAACHGSNGLGRVEDDVPAIAGQHASVLLKQVVDFRNEQRWNSHMQRFTDWHHLPDAQALADVTAYAASLPRFPSLGEIGDGLQLNEGSRLYLQACEGCHGSLGQGDAKRRVPRLAGQRYRYLLRQMDETAAGYRPGMSAEHLAKLRALTPHQMRGLADYMSRAGTEPPSSSMITGCSFPACPPPSPSISMAR